jgi:hypothetical protein
VEIGDGFVCEELLGGIITIGGELDDQSLKELFEQYI